MNEVEEVKEIIRDKKNICLEEEMTGREWGVFDIVWDPNANVSGIIIGMVVEGEFRVLWNNGNEGRIKKGQGEIEAVGRLELSAYDRKMPLNRKVKEDPYIRELLEKNAAITMDEYLKLPEGTRAELIDGRLYDMGSSPTNRDNLFRIKLIDATMRFQHIHKEWHVYMDIRDMLDDTTMVQPEIIAAKRERIRLGEYMIHGAPDLIIEMATDQNRGLLERIKKEKYENAGVLEYWIIYPEEKKTRVYLFGEASSIWEYAFDEPIPVWVWGEEIVLGR